MAFTITTTSKADAQSEADAHWPRLIPPVSERDHAQGLATAAITLVEFGDYLDPQCAAAQPRVKAFQARMGNRLRLVFRHFPASGLLLHAAEAAEAAGRQGWFWEMHDTLLGHPSALGNGYIVEYARDLGLDMERFLRDMTEHVSAERVRLDRISGTQSGVQNTPAFFVNGVRQLHSWEEGFDESMDSATPDDAEFHDGTV